MERDVTNRGPSLEEDSGCTSLEEDPGSTLEDEASLEEEAGVSLEDEELLAGNTTSNDILNFCPLTVTISTAVPGVKPTCTEPSAVTTSPVLLNSMNQRFQVLRSNVCTLLNVMVSNAEPRSTVCSKLPVTTTCMLLLDDGITLLEEGTTLLLDSTLEEDCSELEEAMLELLFSEELLGTTELDEGTALLLEGGTSLLDEDSTIMNSLLELSSLEEDSSLLLDTGTTLLLDSSLEELGGWTLEEDLIELEDITELEDKLEDEGMLLEEDLTLLEEATLELLFTEELLDAGDGTGLNARPEQRTSSTYR